MKFQKKANVYRVFEILTRRSHLKLRKKREAQLKSPVFSLYPFGKDPDCHFLFILGKLSARRNPIPFVHTAAATACAGVLCNKNRMTTHRRLSAVIRYICRSKSLCNKICGVRSDFFESDPVDIVNILLRQAETRPEFRASEPFENIIIHYRIILSYRYFIVGLL